MVKLARMRPRVRSPLAPAESRTNLRRISPRSTCPEVRAKVEHSIASQSPYRRAKSCFNAELLELEVEVRCWRAGDDLFFASIGHFGEGLKAALAANRPPERHVLLDADSVNFVDTSACDALTNVIKELQKPRHHLRLRPCA